MAKKRKSHWTRLLKVCRQEWSRHSPERKQALARAKKEENGLTKWICNWCAHSFALSEVDVDHLEPIRNTIPQTKEDFLDSFSRLYTDLDLLQILCKGCHKKKTKEELGKRKEDLLINLVESYMENYKFDLDDFDIHDLDKKYLRALATLFSKNTQTFNKKTCDKNTAKILNILESCKRLSDGRN